MTIFRILLAPSNFSASANPITIDVEAETIEQADQRLGAALTKLVAGKDASAPPEVCHPGAACSKPEPVDHATWDGSDSYRATIQSLRRTNDRLRADLDWSESLARSRFAEMERLATELKAERAKVEELRSALDTGRDRALEAALDVWRKRALEAEANLADERVKLSAFGETVHRVRAALDDGPGEPAAPGRSAPIGDVPFRYRVDE